MIGEGTRARASLDALLDHPLRLTPHPAMDDREKTWHGVRAASLSIVAGVGHLYLGEKRGYAIIAFGATLFMTSRLFWQPAELLYLSLVIFSAIDAFAIAKRGYGLM